MSISLLILIARPFSLQGSLLKSQRLIFTLKMNYSLSVTAQIKRPSHFTKYKNFEHIKGLEVVLSIFYLISTMHSGLKPPNLLQWPFLGLKMKWNQCRGLGIGSKLLLLTFWNFGLWPCDLLAFGLCDLAENLHAQMEVWKEAACKFSSKSVKKWLIYSIFYVSALTFY